MSQSLELQRGNSYEDFMLLSSSKWVSVREAGAMFVWPPHRHYKGTHFLWLLVFAYTPPLSSCLLALTSCQADREFVPTQWQVSDGKALCPKKTLRPLSLSLPSLLLILSSAVSSPLSSPSLHSSSLSKPFRGPKYAFAPAFCHDFNLTIYTETWEKNKTTDPATVPLGYWWAGI